MKKNVIITGATSGIGREIAIELSRRDYTILAIGRDKSSLESLESTITSTGGTCHGYILDVTDYSGLVKACKHFAETTKSIGWIIHSAGYINTSEQYTDISPEATKVTFETNTFAPMNMTGLLLPILDPDGGIIFIASTAGLRGNPGFPIYAASKGALITFGKSLAKSFEGSQRSAITICPGPTNTPMREKMAHDAQSQQSPKLVADVVRLVLDRDDTVHYKNGDIIVVRDSKTYLYDGTQ